MPAPTSQSQKLFAALLLGLCLALVMLIHVYRPTTNGLWLETFFNSAHYLVFMLVTLGVFVALQLLTNLLFYKCIAVALILGMFLGGLSEFAQIPGPRDASIGDLIANWLGAISALTFLIAASRAAQLGRNARLVTAFAGIAFTLLAVSDLIVVSAAYLERNRSLPIIFSIESKFHGMFVRTQSSSKENAHNHAGNRNVERATVGTGPWPGLVFHDLWPSWEEYSALVIELESDNSMPFELNVRIHDQSHAQSGQQFGDRFNLMYVLEPGSHTVRIPIDDIRYAPRHREMDLSDIHGLVIFSNQEAAGMSFVIHTIRLEK